MWFLFVRFFFFFFFFFQAEDGIRDFCLSRGLGLGSMYGLLALGFHVTHAVSRTVNFAQGSTMMLGAVLLYGLTVTHHVPGPVAVVVALALCGAYGLIVEGCV